LLVHTKNIGINSTQNKNQYRTQVVLKQLKLFFESPIFFVFFFYFWKLVFFKSAGLRRLLTLNLGLKFNFIMLQVQKHSNWWIFREKVKMEPKIRMVASRRNLFPKSKNQKDRLGTKFITNQKWEVSKLNEKQSFK
jgi:hypothetical protein